MAVEAKHRHALGRLIRPHPLEDTGSVVETVRKHVHFCVVPRHELPVEPDLLRRLESHGLLRLGGRSQIYKIPRPKVR